MLVFAKIACSELILILVVWLDTSRVAARLAKSFGIGGLERTGPPDAGKTRLLMRSQRLQRSDALSSLENAMNTTFDAFYRPEPVTKSDKLGQFSQSQHSIATAFAFTAMNSILPLHLQSSCLLNAVRRKIPRIKTSSGTPSYFHLTCIIGRMTLLNIIHSVTRTQIRMVHRTWASL